MRFRVIPYDAIFAGHAGNRRARESAGGRAHARERPVHL